ncbi:MAG: sarcosine oxidase subunit delta [Thiotrichales bacterium]
MKLVPCPDIGNRPRSEFDYVGEVQKPWNAASKAPWGEYIFNRSGEPGVLREWWYHRPSGQWYVFERDTIADEIIRLVQLSEIQHDFPT